MQIPNPINNTSEETKLTQRLQQRRHKHRRNTQNKTESSFSVSIISTKHKNIFSTEFPQAKLIESRGF